MRKLFAVSILLLIIMVGGSPATASELDDRLAEEQAKLRASMQAEQSLLKQIYSIEHIQYQHEKRLAQIVTDLEQVRATIEGDKQSIVDMEADLPVRNARLSRRLAALYRMGRGGFWKILMTSDSFNSFVTRYRALRKIVELDAENLARHRVEILAIRQRRGDLLRRQAELEALARQEKGTALDVEVEKRKKVFLLEEIQRNKQLSMRLTREMEQQDAALGQTVATLPPPSGEGPLSLDFAGRRGYLPSPVVGPIVGRFGVRVNSQFGTHTRSNGIDIAAPAGTPVRVVADGEVRYIGEFMGYGRVVIVDHGDRYHTLYAHLAVFNVARADRVRRGDVLGTVGTSGIYTQPVLHFEIRYRGSAVDPMEWLTPNP